MNYNDLMLDNTNHALLPNEYLDYFKNETDKDKRFEILKKYFTEDITKNVYQDMDLLNTQKIESEKFNNTRAIIKKHLILKILLAVNTLVSERQYYDINLAAITSNSKIFGSESIASDNEYSICQLYMNRNKNKYLTGVYKNINDKQNNK